MDLAKYAALHAQDIEEAQAVEEPQEAQAALEKEDPSLEAAGGAPEALPKKEAAPGGYEIILADIRQRRRLLKRAARQIQEQSRKIDAAIQALDDEERALYQDRVAFGALDHALLDVLTMRKQLPFYEVEAAIKEIERLYGRYADNMAAMGLLYGCALDLTLKASREKQLDLVSQYDFAELKKKIGAAMGL